MRLVECPLGQRKWQNKYKKYLIRKPGISYQSHNGQPEFWLHQRNTRHRAAFTKSRHTGQPVKSICN